MFNSTKEFDEAMVKVLLNIKEGKFYPRDFDFEISEIDAYDVIVRAYDLNYITGISFPSGLGYKASMNTRLCYDGLKFLELSQQLLEKK